MKSFQVNPNRQLTKEELQELLNAPMSSSSSIVGQSNHLKTTTIQPQVQESSSDTIVQPSEEKTMKQERAYNRVLGKIPCLYKLKWDPTTFQLVAGENDTEMKLQIPMESKVIISVKLDGECCWISDEGVPMRRRDLKKGRVPPKDWVQTDQLDANGHMIGFFPIQNDGSAKYMKQALNYTERSIRLLNVDMCTFRTAPWDAYRGRTLEFVGTKVQGNPYGLTEHGYYLHGEFPIANASDVPWTQGYSAMKRWFIEQETSNDNIFEGLVFRDTEDDQMYKLTRHHLELPWPNVVANKK